VESFGLNFGGGLARDAVEDNIGVANDDERTAGTEVDFANLTRLAASSAAGEAGVVRGLLSFAPSDDCESGDRLNGVLFH